MLLRRSLEEKGQWAGRHICDLCRGRDGSRGRTSIGAHGEILVEKSREGEGVEGRRIEELDVTTPTWTCCDE